MKLSGHNYNNDIFNSLLDGLSDDVILKTKTAQKKAPPIDFNFTTTTEENFKGVMDDELEFIANELVFAAKRANVELQGSDLVKFANQSKSQGLRGKNLERAARKYCNEIGVATAPLQGVTRVSSAEDLIRHANASSITPAGSADGNMNHGRYTYMGQSSNPNSIFDSEALHRLAGIPEQHQDRYGDEQISASKEAEKAFRKDQKHQAWQALQDKLADKNMLNERIISAATVESSAGNQNLPANSMSMFSNDRDFSNIPEHTAGELIKAAAKDRSEKSAQAKNQWNKVASCTKANNNPDFLFDNMKSNEEVQGVKRAAADEVFEGLLNSMNEGK